MRLKEKNGLITFSDQPPFPVTVDACETVLANVASSFCKADFFFEGSPVRDLTSHEVNCVVEQTPLSSLIFYPTFGASTKLAKEIPRRSPSTARDVLGAIHVKLQNPRTHLRRLSVYNLDWIFSRNFHEQQYIFFTQLKKPNRRCLCI